MSRGAISRPSAYIISFSVSAWTNWPGRLNRTRRRSAGLSISLPSGIVTFESMGALACQSTSRHCPVTVKRSSGNPWGSITPWHMLQVGSARCCSSIARMVLGCAFGGVLRSVTTFGGGGAGGVPRSLSRTQAPLGAEFGEDLLVPIEFADLEEVEPAEREIRHQHLGLRSGEHTPHLGVQHAGTSQFARVRELEQLIVGGPLPQEERQTRGQLQIAQRIEFRVFLRPGDSAIEKIRAHQNRSHHLFDPGVESAGSFMAGVVEGHQPVYIFLGDGPAEGTPGEILSDALGAGAFLLGDFGLADE